MQGVYIAPGKVLLSWDTGQGPTWAVDPEGKEIKAKYLGTCEVWRCANAVDSGGPAVKLGETEAEAFYDVTAPNGATLTYWVMEQTAAGSRQVGPTVDVLMPQNGSNDPQVLDDKVPPSVPDDLAATVTADGNLLEWLPSQDAESGLLAYFVYDSNQDQPDSVVWASDEEGQRVASFLDRTPDADKGYMVGAIDVALNLSDLAGPVLPVAVPVARLKNLCWNPRAHFDLNGWYVPQNYVELRMTDPPQTLPDGADACIMVTIPGVSYDLNVLNTWAALPGSWAHLYVGAQYTSSDHGNWGPKFYAPVIGCYDGDVSYIADATLSAYTNDQWYMNSVADGWRDGAARYDLPEGTVYVNLIFKMLLHNYQRAYFTKVIIADGDSIAYPDTLYGDGDMDGWSWEGDAHNSVSDGPA